MRRLIVGAIVIPGLLALAVSSRVQSAAQAPRTTKEMEEFVAKASTPADHAALSQHYVDMAARYVAEADTHTAMAVRYRAAPGNPNRRFGDPGLHCDRLVQGAREAAASARELATYHERQATDGATGDVKALPKGPALSMATRQFPDLLPPKQAEELVATANTPGDHTKLGKHFAAQAARYEDDADRHAGMAAGYRAANRRGRLEGAAGHCDRLVQKIRDAASAARELAAYHQQMAK